MFFLADPAHGVEPFLIPADSQAASVNYGMIITLLRRPSRYVAASRLPLAAQWPAQWLAHYGLHIVDSLRPGRGKAPPSTRQAGSYPQITRRQQVYFFVLFS
jgi:hypothetical protein